MSPLIITVLGLTVLSTALWGLTVQSAWQLTSSRGSCPRDSRSRPLPPLSLIKPVKGSEEALEANLRSFFEQEYPAPWEIVFASADLDDPGMAIARRVAADYPRVGARFVRSDPAFGLNPKVANVQGALRRARHDLVFQTDANVRARPGFLRQVVEDYQNRRASLLGLLVVGTGERSIGAALENLQLGAAIAPLMAAVQRLTSTVCLVGKALLFRRSELDALGGLARLKDALAEDFLLGDLYRRAGMRVVLSSVTVENVNIQSSVGAFVRRHSRWLKMRLVISRAGFICDLLVNPVIFGLAAWLSTGFDPRVGLALLGLVVLKTTVDRRLVARLRGAPMRLSQCWLTPVRDVLIAGVWLNALWSRTTEWRGRRFRLMRGSHLVPVGPTCHPRLIAWPGTAENDE